MTVVPQDPKYRVIIGLREPSRKIRLRPCTAEEVVDLKRAIASTGFTSIEAPMKDGGGVIVPAHNVAYVEVHDL